MEPGMKKRYLLCPQCGTHRFYIMDDEGQKIYFHVDWDRIPFPTQTSNADLTGWRFDRIYSTGCSWKGSLKALVKYMR